MESGSGGKNTAKEDTSTNKPQKEIEPQVNSKEKWSAHVCVMTMRDGMPPRLADGDRGLGLVLIEDDQGADDTGNPAEEGKDKNDRDWSTSAVNNRKGREDDCQYNL